MTRKPARQRQTKSEKLLEAALELFSASSYAEVTMQAIAQRAGTTYSLMYYYYKNKEDLFHAAISHSIDRTIESYNNLQKESDSPVDLISDWLENNIKLSESLKRVVKIMFEFSEKREGSPTVQKDIVYFYEFERKLIADSIRLGVERDIFTCADPEATATFVSSHIDGIFYGALVRPGMDIEASMRELKSVLWTLLGYQPVVRRRKVSAA